MLKLNFSVMSKIGHKYTKEFKNSVVMLFNENKDLKATVKKVREQYPNIGFHIVRAWIDPVYRKKIITRSNKANKKWQEKNPEKYKKLYYSVNTRYRTLMKTDPRFKKQRYQKTKEWRLNNIEYVREYDRKRRALNKEQIKNKIKHRKETDIAFKILENTRVYVYQQLKKAHKGITNKKTLKTQALLGCTRNELAEYLRKQYKPGMTDQNYGKEWHIDHIIPCSSFDLTKEEEIKKCFHYTNLQPLWKEENLKKSNKILS